ncbi:MAG: sucrose-phosphate synthase [Gammaproteobacteria bacterium]|jgi:sucrose-phosphate synthase
MTTQQPSAKTGAFENLNEKCVQGPPEGGLYLCFISIHGLIRGHSLELGRDADTGGQTKYVVELARALMERPEVARVDLITRRVEDDQVSSDYAQAIEPLGRRGQIVRIDAGPPGYIAKEQLWEHLHAFIDNAMTYLGEQPRQPDLLHSHYADAGFVGSRISHVLGIPLVHTGHSLGRVKRRRLLASGVSASDIETRFNISMRIEAEENTLASAERVITSTQQEVDEQYGLYDFYQPDRMRVIPPGTDLEQFHPPDGGEWQTPIADTISRFLKEPEKPIILALSRPDPRKNIAALVKAYAGDEALQVTANLVIVAGNRETIEDLDQEAQDVLSDLLWQIDRFDLYGKVAYPKHHEPTDVSLIYRLAVVTGGVFVNPALTEPFGLTLIEAAASGLPIVATEDGGPRDIIENCQNGVLVNPLEPEDIANGIKEVLSDWETWQKRSLAGLNGVREHYSWTAHAESYLRTIRPVVDRTSAPLTSSSPVRRPLRYHDRAIFTDLDKCLLTDPQELPPLIELIRSQHKVATFGIATGRRLDSALSMIKRHHICEPHVLITSCGTDTSKSSGRHA